MKSCNECQESRAADNQKDWECDSALFLSYRDEVTGKKPKCVKIRHQHCVSKSDCPGFKAKVKGQFEEPAS
jgi:hypothetical protein